MSDTPTPNTAPDEPIDPDKRQTVEGTTHTTPSEVVDDGNTGADNVNNPERNDNAFAGEVTMDEASGGA